MNRKHLLKVAVFSCLILLLVALPFLSACAAQPPAAKPPIKIGRLGAVTGGGKTFSGAATAGSQVFFALKNWEVAGRKIELIIEDSEGKTDAGIAKIKKLFELDKVVAMFGPSYSSVTYAVRDYVDQQGIPIFQYAGASGTTRKLASPAIFRICPSMYQQQYEQAKWVVKQGHKNSIYMGTDYAAPREGAKAWKRGFEEAGGKVVDELWHPFNTMDFAPYITKIKDRIAKGEVDVIGSAMWGGEATRIITQWNEYGMKGTIPFYGDASFTEEGFGLEPVGELAVGFRNFWVYSLYVDTPENKKFIEEYTKIVGKSPGGYAWQGYVAAQILYEAIESLDGNAEDSAKLIQAIEKVKIKEPMGQTLQFEKNHSMTLDYYVLEVRMIDGEPHNYHIDILRNVEDPVQEFPE